MGQSDNEFDLDYYKKGKGWLVVVNYWYTKKSKKQAQKRILSSCTTYSWYTECQELIKFFQKKRTKVFYSQLRVLCREFGEKEKSIY